MILRETGNKVSLKVAVNSKLISEYFIINVEDSSKEKVEAFERGLNAHFHSQSQRFYSRQWEIRQLMYIAKPHVYTVNLGSLI